MTETRRDSGTASAPLCREIPAEAAGIRLDAALKQLFPEYSRAQLQKWLKAGRIRVDGAQPSQRLAVRGGEQVEVEPEAEAAPQWRAERVPLPLVFEDEHLIVLDKPAGWVVHPAAGHVGGTLINALLGHAPELARLPRAGLIHRLDKDTTGLLVVARSPLAHTKLAEAMAARRIKRHYVAVVTGPMIAGGTVNAPLARHGVDRKRRAVSPGGKPAITHYRIRERYPAHALLDLELETGRTHQIRVHMAHIRHPVVGDTLYGARPKLPPQPTEAITTALRGFRRQALHARRLVLEHPASGAPMDFRARIPADMAALIEALRTHAEQWAEFRYQRQLAEWGLDEEDLAEDEDEGEDFDPDTAPEVGLDPELEPEFDDDEE